MNEEYNGRIRGTDPGNTDPWKALVEDRYTLASLFCRDKKVLDSCCGTGWATIKYLAPIAYSVTGFDMCEEMSRMSGAPANCHFMQMDATKIGLANDKFDIILALDSIEHFSYENAKKYLLGLSNAGKDNGIILGSTPLVIHDSLKPLFLGWNKYHLFMYTRNDLKKQLKSIFPKVKIFELYHPVCPYFVFICSTAESSTLLKEAKLVKDFILKNISLYKKSWFDSHFFWISRLLRKGMLKAAGITFLNIFKPIDFLHHE